MPLNKSRGNMYPWVDYTLTIYRKCDHDCVYCYRKAIPNYEKLSEVAKGDFKLNLSNKGIIFVANTGDLFGQKVDYKIIAKILKFLNKFPENTYVLQTKNPQRWLLYEIDALLAQLPNLILGTTVETNRETSLISKAPPPIDRIAGLKKARGKRKFISIEPILDFDVEELISNVRYANPEFVSIGADSKGNILPEPPSWKIVELIKELEKFTEIKTKNNLERLLRR